MRKINDFVRHGSTKNVPKILSTRIVEVATAGSGQSTIQGGKRRHAHVSTVVRDSQFLFEEIKQLLTVLLVRCRVDIIQADL